MSSAYSRSITVFSGILVNWCLCLVKSKSSILAFLITQSMTTTKRYGDNMSPCNTPVLTSNSSVYIPLIMTAEHIPSYRRRIAFVICSGIP